jgi:hypothetical protein
MGEEILRAPVDLGPPSQIVDAPGLRELPGVDPSLEPFEARLKASFGIRKFSSTKISCRRAITNPIS